MLGGWYPTASLQECEKMQCGWCREKSGIAQQGRTNKDGATKYYINWWPTWRDRLFSREKGEGDKQQHLSRILLSFFGCPVLLTLGTHGRAGTDKWWSAGRACHMSRNRGRNLWQCEIYSECMEFVCFEKGVLRWMYCIAVVYTANAVSFLCYLTDRPTSSSSLVYWWIK